MGSQFPQVNAWKEQTWLAARRHMGIRVLHNLFRRKQRTATQKSVAVCIYICIEREGPRERDKERGIKREGGEMAEKERERDR